MPKKEYLTVDELTEKWKCSDADLFHLIATEKIIPSVFFNGKFDAYKAELCVPWDEDSGITFSALHYGDYEQVVKSTSLNGILYLPWGHRGNGNKYIFDYASRKRVIEEFDIIYEPERSFEIEYSQESRKIYATEMIVFMQEEIVLFEREHMQKITEPGYCADLSTDASAKKDKPLSTTERNTLLIMIAALCKEAGINPQSRTSAGKMERLVDALGLRKGITDETARRHLDKIDEALRPRMK